MKHTDNDYDNDDDDFDSPHIQCQNSRQSKSILYRYILYAICMHIMYIHVYMQSGILIVSSILLFCVQNFYNLFQTILFCRREHLEIILVEQMILDDEISDNNNLNRKTLNR